LQPLSDQDALQELALELRRLAEGGEPLALDPAIHHPRSRDAESDAAIRDVVDAAHAVAGRAAADRRLLAENIESLERTNRELRLARDQVIRSARLASAGTLAAGIAHEVGNPLGAIMGFVDVARARRKTEGGDTEILDAIRGEAVRIDRIVRGLLDYARPSSETAEPRSARDIVERVRNLLEQQGKLTTVDCQWEVASGGAQRFEAPHRLEQVLVNLLLNAVHAVREQPDPRITVRVRVEEGSARRLLARREGDPPELNYLHRRRESLDEQGPASVATSEQELVIEVSDNGPGIPVDLAERLFDPFFTTKEPGEGTGLGLSICARLTEGMGGRIEVGTNRDRGARFLIHLPMTYDVSDSPGDRTTENA
jgi:C4-dicarboxylate-specific signal transduction histidine kinase